MLDFDTAVDLLKQYGYSSTTSHPYLYQNEDSIGICYLYNDEEYGTLERVRIFKDYESFEVFLKELEWLKVNGMQRHVRMILDNYEMMAPKVMYLRNEKLMVEGEMFEIENFDFREAQRETMDDVSKVIYEAGDLLLVYDEMKGRQLQYLKNIIKLENSLRQKYFDLQKEVDEYNRYKVDRELRLLPEVADSGINETLEIALKDKYNRYIAERPSYEEACEFLREVWELCKQLELNLKYYDAQKKENDVHNELKMVNQKLELMNTLNDEGRPLFGVDLVGRFRKINKECMNESTSISDEWIQAQVQNIERKYSVFDYVDIINTSDYLREAIQNSNYADLAIKYRKGVSTHTMIKAKVPLNEVAANLSIQYGSSLTPSEQAILILYNNLSYRKICDAILRVENFDNLPVKKVISIISKTKEYSKIKSLVYDTVKKRLSDPINDMVKNSLFSQIDFSTYESFITSIINSLIQLKNINTKMLLGGDINMYIKVDRIDEIKNSRFTNVTNALNDLLGRTKGTKSMIGIVQLKENTPVLYSPYCLDIGDVYSKGASLQMTIKEMVDFELLIDCADVIVNIDPKTVNVVRYYSTPKTIEDISVVTDIKMNYKTTFCKYAFTSSFENNVENVTVNNVINNNISAVLTNEEQGVVNNGAVVVGISPNGNEDMMDAQLPVVAMDSPVNAVNDEAVNVTLAEDTMGVSVISTQGNVSNGDVNTIVPDVEKVEPVISSDTDVQDNKETEIDVNTNEEVVISEVNNEEIGVGASALEEGNGGEVVNKQDEVGPVIDDNKDEGNILPIVNEDNNSEIVPIIESKEEDDIKEDIEISNPIVGDKKENIELPVNNESEVKPVVGIPEEIIRAGDKGDVEDNGNEVKDVKIAEEETKLTDVKSTIDIKPVIAPIRDKARTEKMESPVKMGGRQIVKVIKTPDGKIIKKILRPVPKKIVNGDGTDNKNGIRTDGVATEQVFRKPVPVVAKSSDGINTDIKDDSKIKGKPVNRPVRAPGRLVKMADGRVVRMIPKNRPKQGIKIVNKDSEGRVPPVDSGLVKNSKESEKNG